MYVLTICSCVCSCKDDNACAPGRVGTLSLKGSLCARFRMAHKASIQSRNRFSWLYGPGTAFLVLCSNVVKSFCVINVVCVHAFESVDAQYVVSLLWKGKCKISKRLKESMGHPLHRISNFLGHVLSQYNMQFFLSPIFSSK